MKKNKKRIKPRKEYVAYKIESGEFSMIIGEKFKEDLEKTIKDYFPDNKVNPPLK